MEDLEVRGFEPNGRNLPARVNEIRNALIGRDIEVSAICAGFDGFILAEDPAVKASSFDKSMRGVVAAAGELGSVGVIMVRLSTARLRADPTPWIPATTSASSSTTSESSPLSTARP